MSNIIILRNVLLIFVVLSIYIVIPASANGLAVSQAGIYEEVITVPAEKSEGVTIDLEKGDYLIEFCGGAISLFYPINPNYRWLVGVAVGVDVQGGQDYPDVGTIYFEPVPDVFTQYEAEKQALSAAQNRTIGTFLRVSLEKNKTVRFWVSDFDYSDNSGMIKLTVKKID